MSFEPQTMKDCFKDTFESMLKANNFIAQYNAAGYYARVALATQDIKDYLEEKSKFQSCTQKFGKNFMYSPEYQSLEAVRDRDPQFEMLRKITEIQIANFIEKLDETSWPDQTMLIILGDAVDLLFN